jgi:hypothetical protein
MNHEETRNYIHDLANNFSIIDASLARALTTLTRDHPQLLEEIQRLKKADEYVKKSIQTLRDLRTHIHSQLESEQNRK